MKIKRQFYVQCLIVLLVIIKGYGMNYQKINLNGIWDLTPGIDMPKEWSFKVPVPALVDIATPSIDWEKYQYFWYRKEFRLNENADFGKIYLQLEQVQFGTEVWLNGKRVGGDIPCYTSQEFDLTPFVRADEVNELFIRVGSKSTLPEKSAVGNDFEKISFVPGIWGDAWLHLYGNARINWTRIIPDVDKGIIQIHSEIEGLKAQPGEYKIEYRIYEKSGNKQVGEPLLVETNVNSESMSTIDTEMSLPRFDLWSPENPFLYTLEVLLKDKENIHHSNRINFGMREFEIRDGDFYLNGKRRVLMGSNIAFHRMLSDSTRGVLPWDQGWIKKVLVDIPKAHNMFFFRFHLGHAYNRWYDIADEYGILLHDEWMFWTSSGSTEQIESEFHAWIKENVNHPSIIIWDALNESGNPQIVEQIIPKIKNELDPARPWEMVDFEEDHPYIYSLGPVLNKSKFGYSRSIFDLKNSPTPTMVNEYLWWWLDHDGEPTNLTKVVLERWVGRDASKSRLLEHQSFLASELTELWRRLDLDAIMPFVYLSVGYGATANWFFGSLEDLQPKPILSALKNTFSPVGVSIELWDRHFLCGEKKMIDVYLFNDTQLMKPVHLKLFFAGRPDNVLFDKTLQLSAGEHRQLTVPIIFPQESGKNWLIGQILDDENVEIAFSKKPIIVFNSVLQPDINNIPSISLHDPGREITQFFSKYNIQVRNFPDGLDDSQVVIINGNGINDSYQNSIQKLSEFVERGGILIFQEPEFGVETEKSYAILKDLEIIVQYREDPERGGYDSFIFPEDISHFLWKELEPDHFRFFNGGFGGEIVSQHNVRPTVPYHAVANCNLSLKVPAVLEIPHGKGWVIISRIQVRGRLLQEESSSGLYERRYDPVAEQYFWNLITGYINQDSYNKRIQEELSKTKIYMARIKASSGQIYDALDGKMTTRWSSKAEDPQWIWIDFGRPTKLEKLDIHWEVAYGKEYEVFQSNDDQNWQLIFSENNSDGEKDEINFSDVETRFLRINFKKRGTQWGYSIWEMEFE